MMKQIQFLPWVGRDYVRGINGKHVMVLGESHYCANNEEAVPGITQDVISGYIDSSNDFEGWMNTYTKFIRALSGKEISREASEEWWEHILFYNYVQVPMTGPRTAPSEQEFRDSDDAFFKILETYVPDKVIAWGQRLYGELPDRGHRGKDIIAPDGQQIETWVYLLKNGHSVEVLGICHPSAGFAWDYWHEVIASFLK